jgi:hypothetical protein
VDSNAQKDESNVRASSSSTVNENDIGASSSRLSKKAKKDDSGKAKKEDNVVESLVQVFGLGTQSLATLANVINEAVVANSALPDDLFEIVDNLTGFELDHKSMYYTHLVANPNIARAFMKLPLPYKISWVTAFVNGKM